MWFHQTLRNKVNALGRHIIECFVIEIIFANRYVAKRIKKIQKLSCNPISLFKQKHYPIVSTSHSPANGDSPDTLQMLNNIVIRKKISKVLDNSNNIQYISYNTNTPHIRCKCYCFKVNNLL